MKIKPWLLAFLFCLTSSIPADAQRRSDYLPLFDEVVSLIETHFYDPSAVSDARWQKRVVHSREQIKSIEEADQFANAINSLLATLHTSHSHFFSKGSPKRYQLLGLFSSLYSEDRKDLFIYEGIGIDTRNIDGQVVICSVFDGFPAQEAGLQYGDRILSVNDVAFHPIGSFEGRAGATVRISLDRRGVKMNAEVKVVKLDGRMMFEEAANASVRLIEHQGKKVGYIHLWSYAGARYQELLREKILWGALSKADALVLDLRDGWGGADLNYLNLFREPIAMVSSRDRNGSTGSYSGVWENPVALIVNERTTSGKELFTYGFKKLQLGPVVGNTTAGAVVAGRIFLLSSGDVLYLAVRDVSVDGMRLEGKGVDPDIPVDRSLRQPPAEDVQLQKAIEEVARQTK